MFALASLLSSSKDVYSSVQELMARRAEEEANGGRRPEFGDSSRGRAGEGAGSKDIVHNLVLLLVLLVFLFVVNRMVEQG